MFEQQSERERGRIIIERQKKKGREMHTESWKERPVESEVKEALDRGLKALIHHLITSAVCVCSFTSLPMVFLLCLCVVLCLHTL